MSRASCNSARRSCGISRCEIPKLRRRWTRGGSRPSNSPMRTITVGAAQLGPIARDESRAAVVMRMVVLLREARQRDCDLVAFPELALTTFFPRWSMTSPSEIDAFFETEMPGRDTKPLFDEARR